MIKFNIHDWRHKQSLKENYIDDIPSIPLIIEKLRSAISNKDWNLVEEVLEDLWSVGNKPLTNLQDFELNEHHEEDSNFPGKEMSAFELLDKIEKQNPSLYSDLENFMRSMNEASVLGTGASFSSGNGEGYMTSRAFGKKNNKKNR